MYVEHGARDAVAAHEPPFLSAQFAKNPDMRSGGRITRTPLAPCASSASHKRIFSGTRSSVPLSRPLLCRCRFISRSQDEIPAADALPRVIVEGRHVSSSVSTCGLWSRWSQPRPRDHGAPMPASSGMGKNVSQAGRTNPAHRAQEAGRPVPNRTDDDRQRNVNPCRWPQGSCRGSHVQGTRRILGDVTSRSTRP